MSTLPDRPERRRLADLAAINEQYLYQCMTGRRDMDAVEAARVEEATGKQVRRWQVRRDWFKVWPELVGQPGAPKLPRAAERRLAKQQRTVVAASPVAQAERRDPYRARNDAAAERLAREVEGERRGGR